METTFMDTNCGDILCAITNFLTLFDKLNLLCTCTNLWYIACEYPDLKKEINIFSYYKSVTEEPLKVKKGRLTKKCLVAAVSKDFLLYTQLKKVFDVSHPLDTMYRLVYGKEKNVLINGKMLLLMVKNASTDSDYRNALNGDFKVKLGNEVVTGAYSIPEKELLPTFWSQLRSYCCQYRVKWLSYAWLQERLLK